MTNRFWRGYCPKCDISLILPKLKCCKFFYSLKIMSSKPAKIPTSRLYFRIKSCTAIQDLLFTGLELNVKQLKFEISKSLKLTSDLQIYSRENKLLSDEIIVRRNETVIVKRVPCFYKYRRNGKIDAVKLYQMDEEERLRLILRQSYNYKPKIQNQVLQIFFVL